jgi:hypothetical protein
MQRCGPCEDDSSGSAGKATGGKGKGWKNKDGKIKSRKIGGSRLIESGQLDQVVEGDSFYWIARFAPGAEASGDYEDFES